VSAPEPQPVSPRDLGSGGRPRARFLWVVGLALYVAIIWYIGWRRIGGALASMDLRFLAAMVGVNAAVIWVRALKWRLVLGAGQNAIGLHFVSKIAGGYSPARLGELAPLAFQRHRTARMGAWILVDRLLETGATLGLGLFGVIALQLTQWGIVAAFAAAALLLVAVPFYVFTRRRLFVWLAERTRERSLVHKVSALLAAMSDEIRGLGRHVPIASAITVLATSLDILVAIMLYLAFGHWVAFALLATVQCAHGITSALPFLPNATGVPYLVAAGLLYTMGGVPEEVLATAVGVNMVVANGLLWTFFGLTAGDLRRRPARGGIVSEELGRR